MESTKGFHKHTLAKDVKTLRRVDLDISMQVAADLIGISKPTLSRLEQGCTVDIETFAKVILWLKADPNRYIN
jgi:DNA-binding transcriptional regulator YiaG